MDKLADLPDIRFDAAEFRDEMRRQRLQRRRRNIIVTVTTALFIAAAVLSVIFEWGNTP